MSITRKGFIFLIILLGLLASSPGQAAVARPGRQATPDPHNLEYLVPQVLSRRPHDVTSFVEGLVWDNGTLYESAGLNGQSSLRQVDPLTGQVIRRISIPDQYFAEGIALVGNHLIQLTWQEHTAFVYNVKTFEQIGSFIYDGEGWGMCYDGSQLYMSNGSSTIVARDPQTFEITRSIPVTLIGQPLDQLNELECVGDSLYANVWQTDHIVRIDKATGYITALIDAAGLLTKDERSAAGLDGVLNGIAYDADHKTFLITGKNWPWLFEVKFVPSPN